MIEVPIIKKFINSMPIEKAIIQHDVKADLFRFKLSTIYHELDFSKGTWFFFLYSRNTMGVERSRLLKTHEVKDGFVYIDWVPDFRETDRNGYYEFQIKAQSDLEGGVVRWATSVARIKLGKDLRSTPYDKDVLQDYLDMFIQLCSSATIDAETQRAIAAELELANKITDLEKRINVKIDILEQNIQNVLNSLTLENYTYPEENKGELSKDDTFIEAFEKLQYQIKNLAYEGTLSVEKGGTGATYLDGVLVGTGTNPITGIKGKNGQVLKMKNGLPTFTDLNIKDVSGTDSMLYFERVSKVDFVSPFSKKAD